MEFALEETVSDVLHQIDVDAVLAEVLYLLHLVVHAHFNNELGFFGFRDGFNSSILVVGSYRARCLLGNDCLEGVEEVPDLARLGLSDERQLV